MTTGLEWNSTMDSQSAVNSPPTLDMTTQTDTVNVIVTSPTDVLLTQSQFASFLQSQLPNSITPTGQSSSDSLDISKTQDTASRSALPTRSEVNQIVPSMPPSLITSSSISATPEYSSPASDLLVSTPFLPQFSPVAPQRTNVIAPTASQDFNTSLKSSSNRVTQKSDHIWSTLDSSKLSVPPVSKTKNVLPSKSGVISYQPSKVSPTKSGSYLGATETVITTVVPGLLPGTTPDLTRENKTGPRNPHGGFPQETILLIVIPVCVIFLLLVAAILFTCVRRKRLKKKQSQDRTNPDLWVNAQTELNLVPPTSPSVVESPTDIVPGFKPGECIYRVAFEFAPQLEGQMCLKEKELIKVTEKTDNGWWRGMSQRGERSGWFPGCYVEEVVPVESGQTTSKSKSRVSSFLLRKKEQIRRKSAANVSTDVSTGQDNLAYRASTHTNLTTADISRFADGKLYKAQYGYNGSSKGELSVEVGDLLRGWEKDRNGWMHGRKVTSGEEGWFPAVYVEEMTADTVSVSGESTLSSPIMYNQLAPNRTKGVDQEWLGIEHRAIHPFTSETDTDLSFEAGNVIMIYETLDNGWWLGSHGEEVGWLPGSYLEILDTSRDDDSKSDVSSVLSYRTEGGTIDLTPSQSQNSLLNDVKPKPARKAPPPPKLKPLKIPTKDNEHRSSKSDLLELMIKNQGLSPRDQPESPARNVSPKEMLQPNQRPKRPAPPPPPAPSNADQSQLVPPGESVPAIVLSPAEAKPKPREKPRIPKRFAEPKLIRVPRRSSKLQNLSMKSRPSARPPPPRPPPPKFKKNHPAKSNYNQGLQANKSDILSSSSVNESGAPKFVAPEGEEQVATRYEVSPAIVASKVITSEPYLKHVEPEKPSVENKPKSDVERLGEDEQSAKPQRSGTDLLTEPSDVSNSVMPVCEVESDTKPTVEQADINSAVTDNNVNEHHLLGGVIVKPKPPGRSMNRLYKTPVPRKPVRVPPPILPKPKLGTQAKYVPTPKIEENEIEDSEEHSQGVAMRSRGNPNSENDVQSDLDSSVDRRTESEEDSSINKHNVINYNNIPSDKCASDPESPFTNITELDDSLSKTEETSQSDSLLTLSPGSNVSEISETADQDHNQDEEDSKNIAESPTVLNGESSVHDSSSEYPKQSSPLPVKRPSAPPPRPPPLQLSSSSHPDQSSDGSWTSPQTLLQSPVRQYPVASPRHPLAMPEPSEANDKPVETGVPLTEEPDKEHFQSDEVSDSNDASYSTSTSMNSDAEVVNGDVPADPPRKKKSPIPPPRPPPSKHHDMSAVNGQTDLPGSPTEAAAEQPVKKKSPVPPPRPPPPKSPPPTSLAVIYDENSKLKKRTLRRAVMGHVPQGKGELAFEEGSFIKEISKAMGRPGWCIGMLADGTTGLYPQSHVEDANSNRQSEA